MRLRRADPSRPGIRRVRRGRGFSYLTPDGEPLTDPATLARIRGLVIPPAWREVWICRDPRGHLQATGFDAAGRRQYLYHQQWRERRDRRKFHDMEEFGRMLPRLRTKVHRALDGGTREPDRERVGACAVRLLDVGLFRVGGEQYADSDGGVGLATLTREHVSFVDGQACFDYVGKSGVRRMHEVSDPAVVALLQRLHRRRDGPPELLAYREGRAWHRLGSDGVNDYIKSVLGPDFSAKDFRTWNATVLAAALLAAQPRPRSRTAREREVRRAVQEVAQILGNTPAVARGSYIDPRVTDRYIAGHTIAVAISNATELTALDALGDRRRRRLELAVLDLLG